MIPQDPNPPSPARVAAGRVNGLKSRNTKTPEGKAASDPIAAGSEERERLIERPYANFKP